MQHWKEAHKHIVETTSHAVERLERIADWSLQGLLGKAQDRIMERCPVENILSGHGITCYLHKRKQT